MASKDDDVNDAGNDDGNNRRRKRKRLTKSKPSQHEQKREQPTTTTTTTITCSNCGLELPSRNQLFRHLRSSTKCSLALNNSNNNNKDGSSVGIGVGGEGSVTTKFVKVIFIVAYLGKEYHGCARNDSRDTVPTVEGCLWKGIAGALSEEEQEQNNKKKATSTATSTSFSFALDIKKNTNPKSMTRSSRTDKGVSSLGNVYSLLLPDCTLLEDEVSFASIVNRHLPNDIRLLRVHINNHSNNIISTSISNSNGRSIIIPSSFNARTCCEARRYRYLIPTKALFIRHHHHHLSGENDHDKPTTTEESILDLRKRLKRVLLQWGGTHSFHNFTNWKQQQPPSAVASAVASAASSAVASDREQHKNNQKVEEDDHSRHILRCHVEDVILQSSSSSTSNQDYIVISIKGQSFLYHMIRKMMGATIGVMNGTLSSDFIHRALQLQTTEPHNKGGSSGSSSSGSRRSVMEIMDVPLAPAEGLVLVECIYSKYCSKRNMEPVGLGTKLLSSHHGSGSSSGTSGSGTSGSGTSGSGTGNKRSDNQNRDSGSVATRVDWEKNAAKLAKDTREFEKRVYEQICRDQAENYSSL